MTAFRTRLAEIEDGIDARDFFCKGHIDGTAAVYDQEKLLVFLSAEFNVLPFLFRQTEISLRNLTVSSFTCLTGTICACCTACLTASGP